VAGGKTITERIVKNPNVSTCANPKCGEEFKRLGEGKLFVRRARKTDKGPTQKALWLCPHCIELFDLRYDGQKEEYTLISRRRVA
jgi:hypothetical protein